MAMSAHFFTSLHPCFKESGTCDGVGKQGLVRHSQSPLRPVFESHDSQYIDRKTRRSPLRWSHSLTLPRAPRTVRTAFYMTCFIFTGVSSIPYVRVFRASSLLLCSSCASPALRHHFLVLRFGSIWTMSSQSRSFYTSPTPLSPSPEASYMPKPL